MSAWLYPTILCVLLAPKPPDIEAKYWYNNPPYRVHDDRTVVIFFFKSKDPQSAQLVPRLNRVHRRPDVIVIGITEDSKKDTARFIKATRAKFTIGARSGSAKVFGIGKFPALRRVNPKDRSEMQVIVADSLGEYEPSWGEYGQESVNSMNEEWELEAFIDSDGYGMNRKRAVWKLYQMMEPESFMEFADSQLSTERDPWVRGSLNFLKQRAHGMEAGEPALAPSVQYWRDYNENKDAPEWREANEYWETIDGRTVNQLLEDYWAHSGEDPTDTLVRRWIAAQLKEIPNRREPRGAYLEMLPYEPDFFIRFKIVSGLSETCEVGDEDVAAFLDRQAEIETNLVHVKPIMEYVSNYLRTGEEDTVSMEPRD